MTTLGAVVRQAREKLGGLRQVAEKLEVSAGALSRLENDHPCPFGPDTLVRILEHLGVDRWEGLRLAGVTDPVLAELVQRPSRVLAELLRFGKDATDEEWAAALTTVKRLRARRAG
jgi:transcriptional regulator with XRE-family HTH domain